MRPCAVNGTVKLWLPACPRGLDVPGRPCGVSPCQCVARLGVCQLVGDGVV